MLDITTMRYIAMGMLILMIVAIWRLADYFMSFEQMFWKMYYSNGCGHYDSSQLLDYEKWMKRRVDWLRNRKDYTSEKSILQAKKEYDMYEIYYLYNFCGPNMTPDNREKWLTCKTNYLIKWEGYGYEHKILARNVAQSELDGYIQLLSRPEPPPHGPVEPIIPTYYVEISRASEIKAHTRIYEKKGYSPDEAKAKAIDDYHSDHDPLRNMDPY